MLIMSSFLAGRAWPVAGSAGLLRSGVAARSRKTYAGAVSDREGTAGGRAGSDEPARRTTDGRRDKYGSQYNLC